MKKIQDLPIPSTARNILSKASHDTQVLALGTLMKRLPQQKPFTFTGPDSTYKLLTAIVDAGHSKVLVVADPGLVQLGLIQPYIEKLEELGAKPSLFDGIEPDPSYDVVNAGIDAAKSHDAEAILAIGGGSSLDAAKIIAASVANNCAPEKLAGYFKVRKPMIPYYGVPTTSGTGSEVTLAAVVSNTEKQRKDPIADPKLIPHTIALDPNLQLGLPAPITAATGMDALTHAVESYVSGISTEQTRALSKTATRLIFKSLPTAYKQGDNVEARENMLMASTYAGLAFSRASVGYVHAYAHQFGGLYHVPHGLANAIALPHVFEFYLGGNDACVAKLADLAKEAGVGAKKDDNYTRASKFVDAVKKLNKRIGIPETLDAIEDSDVDEIVDRVLTESQGTYAVPRYMDRADCKAVLLKMMS